MCNSTASSRLLRSSQTISPNSGQLQYLCCLDAWARSSLLLRLAALADIRGAPAASFLVLCFSRALAPARRPGLWGCDEQQNLLCVCSRSDAVHARQQQSIMYLIVLPMLAGAAHVCLDRRAGQGGRCNTGKVHKSHRRHSTNCSGGQCGEQGPPRGSVTN